MQSAAPNFILSMLGRRSVPSINANASINYQNQRRMMAAKPPNRAAIHGDNQLPPSHTLDHREEVEEEINIGKTEKQRKAKQVKETVNSQLDAYDDGQRLQPCTM